MDTTLINVGSNNVSPITANMEDRNRTAPFPFCGNRFEFRAVGSTQNIAFPLAIVNTAYAESMAALSDRIEGGESVRDAVANMFEENMNVIFNGDGYSDEWPIEAEKRGLKNLRNTYEAAAEMNSDKNKTLFESMDVFTVEELEARQEVMVERFTADIGIEADTMLQMVQTGVLPACAQDLKSFENTGIGSSRQAVYAELDQEVSNFIGVLNAMPDGSALEQAKYSQYNIRPAMDSLRAKCDAAELICDDALWPYPKYKDMLFAHHFQSPQFE
jgi:glutamine synthetase